MHRTSSDHSAYTEQCLIAVLHHFAVVYNRATLEWMKVNDVETTTFQAQQALSESVDAELPRRQAVLQAMKDNSVVYIEIPKRITKRDTSTYTVAMKDSALDQ
jgi:hypothetical protein